MSPCASTLGCISTLWVAYRGHLRLFFTYDPHLIHTSTTLRPVSRGIRQRIYNLSKTGLWREKYNIMIGDTGGVEGEGDLGRLRSREPMHGRALNPPACLTPPSRGDRGGVNC